MAEQIKYLYGPVASRRLGLSLGVDIVPFKVCTLDCVYCQLGKTTEKTVERAEYVSPEEILVELKEKLAGGLRADFITVGGSGEPTLNSHLGEIIDGIKKISDIPVAVLTNGTLLYKPDVRADCAKADVVLPSLDAGDKQTFEEINCPHKDILIENLISGLCDFRNEYAGQIWLEVLFVEGLNTGAEQVTGIKKAIERIRPDKVHLNTSVRPTARTVVADFPSARRGKRISGHAPDAVGSTTRNRTSSSCDTPPNGDSDKLGTLLSMLKRMPCSINDICSSLGVHRHEALKYVTALQQQGVINSFEKDGKTFFKSIRSK